MTDVPVNPPVGEPMNLTDQDRIRVCRVSRFRLIQALPRANDAPVPDDAELIIVKGLDNGDFLFVIRSMQFEHYNTVPCAATTEEELLTRMLANMETAPQF